MSLYLLGVEVTILVDYFYLNFFLKELRIYSSRYLRIKEPMALVATLDQKVLAKQGLVRMVLQLRYFLVFLV